MTHNEQLELDLGLPEEEEETLTTLSEISERYIKRILPTKMQRRVFKQYDWEDYPLDFKLLDRAFTLFSITPGMNILHGILYDFYVEGLNKKKLAAKYQYHFKHIQKLKKKGLEEFYKFIPKEYR